MSDVRHLVLVRHATAEASGQAGDEARELTEEGLGEAAAIGTWFKENNIVADLVLCSPAARTRQTWAAIDEASGVGSLIQMEPSIYEASVDALLRCVNQVDPLARTVVLVGHAPGVPTLAAELCDGAGEPEAWGELNRGFEPGSAAIVRLEGEWAGVAFGSGTLTAVRPGGR